MRHQLDKVQWEGVEAGRQAVRSHCLQRDRDGDSDERRKTPWVYGVCSWH